jgi:hypothetical protein
MKTPRRFWHLLERLPSQAAVTKTWETELADEFPWSRRFLRPRPHLAECYPKPHGHRCPEPYEVFSYGDDDHEGVCPRTREVIPLTSHDVTVYELDKHSLFRCLAKVLQIEGSWEAVTDCEETYRLGSQTGSSGRQLEVFLTTVCHTDWLQRVGYHLLAICPEPFVLLTPTSNWFTRALTDQLDRRGSVLVPLADALTLDDQGNLTGTQAVHRALARAAAAMVAPADYQENVFLRHGDVWHVAFAGQTAYVPHCAGMDYIVESLRSPGKVVDALELTATLNGHVGGLVETGIDQTARRVYESRISELRAEIERAESFHDVGRHESLCEELGSLLLEVTQATALGGRLRENSDRERVRKRVVNSVRRAIDQIAKNHPQLAQHLKSYLPARLALRYYPPTPVQWVT